jgi:hypothetical protein
VVGVLLVLVGGAAAIKQLAGDDPAVEIETADDEDQPVDVTVEE